MDRAPRATEPGPHVNPGMTRNAEIREPRRETDDGMSSLQEMTTRTASFKGKLKKQVSFDDESIRTARDCSGGDQLISCNEMNRLHPLVIALAQQFPAPAELELPASESKMPIFQFQRSRSTYFGETEGSKPHGKGWIATSKGAMIQGWFDHGVMNGLARIIDPSGTVYLGYIQNKLKNGRGLYRDPQGCIIDAEWHNGVTNGAVTMKSPSGQILFAGTTSFGKRTGYGQLYNSFQKYTYEGEFADDVYCGRGKKVYESGQVYVGGFANGKENGYGVLQTPDGRTIKANFIDGSPYGRGILITDDGREKQVTF